MLLLAHVSDNGDDNLIMGLCTEKVSIYENVKIQVGVDEEKEISPYCILMCLTCEGKLIMFHVARYFSVLARVSTLVS